MPIDPSKVKWDAPQIDPAAVQWDTPPATAAKPPEPPRSKADMFKDELLGSLPARALYGLRDVVDGGAQLLVRGANAVGLAPDSEVQRVDNIVTTNEAEYQARRDRLGQEGFDAGRFVGNVANPVNYVLPGAAATTAGRMGLGGLQGALSASLQPVLDTDKFGERKAEQTVLGGTLGALIPGAAQLVSRAKNAVQSAATTIPDAVVKTARSAGYVIPPEQANTGLIPKVLNAWGGKIKTEQAASIKNQETTNKLVRQALGLSDDTPISTDLLKNLRGNAGRAYEAIKQAGTMRTDDAYNQALDDILSQYQGAAKSFPGLARDDAQKLVDSLRLAEFDTGSAIDALKVLRESADDAFRAGNTALAKANKGGAKALEDLIERNLKASGSQDLLKAFRQARTDIAKTYTVEKALNDATGNVSARKLASALQRGKPLSGELRQAAEFGQAFPKAAQEVQGVNPYSVLDGALGTAGLFTNPALTAYAAGRPVARNLILNERLQRLLVDRPVANRLGAAALAASGQQAPQLRTELARRLLQGGGASGAAGALVGSELAR